MCVRVRVCVRASICMFASLCVGQKERERKEGDNDIE